MYNSINIVFSGIFMKKQIDKYFYSTFFKLFSVVSMQSLIVFSVNLADSVMLGSYSETAMSGVSLANQIQFLLQMLVYGTANGLVVLASQYWGKKQTAPIKKVLSAAFWVGIFFAVVLGAAVLISPTGLLGLLSDETQIVAEGSEFIKIMSVSYIFFAISSIFVSLMRSVETVKIGFYISVATLIVNISLNYLLIFGKFGCPELGAVGAAYATVAARIVEFVIITIYVFFFDKKLKVKIKDLFSFDKTYIKDYFRTGLPLVGSSGSWGIAMTVQTAVIGRLGEAAIGANAVASPIFQLVAVLYSSASSASSVIIGKTVGENDIPRVKKYSVKLQIIYVITGLVSSALLLLVKNAVIGIYNISDETHLLANTFINILAITVIGSAYEAPCLCGIVSGGGDTKFVLCNDIIFMWGMVIPMSLLSAFVFKWPVAVTFFILKFDQLAKCFVAIPKVNRYRWIHNLTRE